MDSKWKEGAVFGVNPIYEEDGEDLIAQWARTKTPVEFRAAMLFNIEKYQRRYGKKDDVVSESRKIADYSARLAQYEVTLQESGGLVASRMAGYRRVMEGGK
tara:strand:- start:346 stop:651 length:306 start_codon:yes stop_codon:yes gene_type:complete